MKGTPALITTAELARGLREGSFDEVWNALTDEYFTGEMIPGSRRVPMDRVGQEVRESGLAKDSTIAVYCSGPSCPNSRQAAEKLVALGFSRVHFYEGGLEEWKRSGRGVETLQLAALAAA